MKIITTKQMKALESESVNHGVSLAELMDNAGKALADFICSLYDKKEPSFQYSASFHRLAQMAVLR